MIANSIFMTSFMTSRSEEEVVFETPDPPQRVVQPAAAKAATEGLDTSAIRQQDAFESFAKKEAAAFSDALAEPFRLPSKAPKRIQKGPKGSERPDFMIPGSFPLPSSAGVEDGRCHGVPKVIYEKRKRFKRELRCFKDVEDFLERHQVSFQRRAVSRSFLHIHQELGPSKKRKSSPAADAGCREVPAWEEYLKANHFESQLVQTFLLKAKEELIFACVPYPWRPDTRRLAEAGFWISLRPT